MKYLIDTHTLLWALYSSEDLPEKVRQVLDSGDCFISIATFWEMSIKRSLGKLFLPQSIPEIAEICRKYDIQILGIKPEHCQFVSTLPFIHKDPFDRMLIAQAILGDLTILTKDSIIPQYEVKTLW